MRSIKKLLGLFVLLAGGAHALDQPELVVSSKLRPSRGRAFVENRRRLAIEDTNFTSARDSSGTHELRLLVEGGGNDLFLRAPSKEILACLKEGLAEGNIVAVHIDAEDTLERRFNLGRAFSKDVQVVFKSKRRVSLAFGDAVAGESFCEALKAESVSRAPAIDKKAPEEAVIKGVSKSHNAMAAKSVKGKE